MQVDSHEIMSGNFVRVEDINNDPSLDTERHARRRAV